MIGWYLRRRWHAQRKIYGGTSTQPSPQWTKGAWVVQGAIAVPATPPQIVADGYAGPQKLLLTNTGTQAYTANLLGSDDGGTWFNTRYQVIATGAPNTTNPAGAVAAPVNAAGALVIAAASAQELVILDYYAYYELILSAFTAGAVASVYSTLVPI